MTPEEKHDALQRNFNTFCKASNITAATITLHHLSDLHAVITFNPDKCKIVTLIHDTNKSILTSLYKLQDSNNIEPDINLN